MINFFTQSEYEVRCEWGLAGLNALATGSDALVIVDVISFTTSVSLAVERGAWVYPYAGSAEELPAFARSVGAVVAGHDRRAPHSFSLAPSSMLRLKTGERLVLPSPNGSMLSLASQEAAVLAGCLRNARAVAEAAARLGRWVSVIAAGERWPDGRLRPGLEDLLGAGAIIHALPGRRSPEALAAEMIFVQMQSNLLELLRECSSGREAEARGSLADLELAAALNASTSAPRLVEGAYRG